MTDDISYYQSGPALQHTQGETSLRQAELAESQRILLQKQPHRVCNNCYQNKPLTEESYTYYSSTGPYAGQFRRVCRSCNNTASISRSKIWRERVKNDLVRLAARRASYRKYRKNTPEYVKASRRRNYANHKARGERYWRGHWVKKVEETAEFKLIGSLSGEKVGNLQSGQK